MTAEGVLPAVDCENGCALEQVWEADFHLVVSHTFHVVSVDSALLHKRSELWGQLSPGKPGPSQESRADCITRRKSLVWPEGRGRPQKDALRKRGHAEWQERGMRFSHVKGDSE